jgi:hypothetical protein
VSSVGRVEIPERNVRQRPIWYQLMYNLSAHQAHLAMANHSRTRVPIIRRGAPLFFGDARRTAAVLVAAAGETLTELAEVTRQRRFWERIRPDQLVQLQDFLQTSMEPAAAVLLAGLTSGDSSTSVDSYVQAPGHETWSRRQVVVALRLFLENDTLEPGLSRGLYAFAIERPRLTYRVNYNVACYLSGTMGADTDGDDTAGQALNALTAALAEAPNSDRRNLATWARKDPSLDDLRLRKKDDFNNLIDFYSGPSLEKRHPVRD